METKQREITPAELIGKLEEKNGEIIQIGRDTEAGTDRNGITIYNSYYTAANGSRLHICHTAEAVRYYSLTDRHGNTVSNI